MKLLNKKTRKQIEKLVRKSMKKHGPALVAGLASALASSVATLAQTEAPRKGGKSNLADIVDQSAGALSKSAKKSRGGRKRKHEAQAAGESRAAAG